MRNSLRLHSTARALTAIRVLPTPIRLLPTLARMSSSTSTAAIPHWIDNAPFTSQQTTQLRHPNTQADVYLVHVASSSDVDRAISSAQAAFPAWSATPPQERRAILMKAAELLRQRKDQFVESWQSEMDVGEGFAGFNVMTSAGMIEEVASNITTALQGDIPQAADRGQVITLVTREPLGVCLALCPFNAALILSIRGIVTPLAAGNTVVARTSELVPKTQLLWGQLFADAGLPSGCLNILHTDKKDTPERTKQLIEDRRVRHVSFTGSSAVGKHIGRMSGENLKPCILELGGKSPVLVLSDADPTIAANNVIFHALLNSGQICMSTERVIVSPSLHDAFVKSIKEQHPKGKICKVVSPASAAKISGMVSSALKEGAKLVAGNDVWPPSEETLKKGEFPAIILDDIDRSMEIWREETFGPVAVIASSSALRSAITSDLKTSDAEDEAMVTFANDSDFGLAASIFSQDTARAMRVGRHLDIGMIRINSGTVADDAAVPFGGYKDTGFGRFNGVEALRAFTQTKAMTVPLHGAQMLPIH